VEARLRERREKGVLAIGGLEHGHTFLRLIDLRGYDNLLMDMVDEEPYLEKLVGMVEEFNLELVKRYLKAGVEYMMYPEDLGMQIGPMLSPDLFRKYIKPSYERIMQPAREAGVIVHMHSDGDIRTLADDLVEGGVQVINLQDLCNGIDWIAAKFGGKTCVDLDIDRQKITALGTPEQIDALIKEEVSKVGSKEGGLTMLYGLYPGIPHKNVVALMDAMERYMGYYR
jgi:uroporphyrinogen decarboxylase